MHGVGPQTGRELPRVVRIAEDCVGVDDYVEDAAGADPTIDLLPLRLSVVRVGFRCSPC